MNIFKDKEIVCDSEFDIESEDIYAIDRTKNQTCIAFYDKHGSNKEIYLSNNISKHNDYIRRFRLKRKMTKVKII